MRFQMVRHCAACVIPALLKVSTAAAVLALGCVAHQCLSPEWLPMFGAVKRAICLCFGTPFFAHFILYIVYCLLFIVDDGIQIQIVRCRGWFT